MNIILELRPTKCTGYLTSVTPTLGVLGHDGVLAKPASRAMSITEGRWVFAVNVRVPLVQRRRWSGVPEGEEGCKQVNSGEIGSAMKCRCVLNKDQHNRKGSGLSQYW